MKILALDTSTSYLSLAVTNNTEKLCELNKDLKRLNHCQYLIPYLKDMLDRGRLKLSNIDAFCIGLGPGSFTGLRVGLSCLKGLNIIYKKKLIGISSLDAIACNLKDLDKIIVCIKDAKKQKVYGCLYFKNGGLVRLTDYLLVEFKTLMDLVKKISKKKKRGVVFTADGINVFKKDISKSMPQAEFSLQKTWHPRAFNLALLASKLLKDNKNTISLDDIEPLYLHSEYANITKPKKLKGGL